MQLSVKGKQIDVGDALTTHVQSALTSTVSKYFDNALEGTVHFSREGALFRTDISVHVGHNILIQSHDEADEPYAAFDLACEKLGKRLRRYKRRLRDHHKERSAKESVAAQQYILAPPGEEDEDSTSQATDQPIIIAEMTTEVATMTVSQAVMRMDLAELPALLFHNSAHGGLNMVYHRQDGNVGWIDPTESTANKETTAA